MAAVCGFGGRNLSWISGPAWTARTIRSCRRHRVVARLQHQQEQDRGGLPGSGLIWGGTLRNWGCADYAIQPGTFRLRMLKVSG